MGGGTRLSSECPIFGSPKDISFRSLPTYEDVMKYYAYVRLEIKERKDPSFKQITVVVAQQLETLWKRASIPHLSRKRITSMMQQYRLKINNLLKSKSKNSDNFKSKVQKMRDMAAKTLFDISACKCLDFEQCTCTIKNKVPLAERDFLSDQRSERRMVIAGLDITATKANKKRNKRRMARAKQYHHQPTCSATSINSQLALELSENSNSNEDSDTSSSDFNAPLEASMHSKKSRKGPVPDISVFAEACDRTGVSNRAAAFLASSMLQDVGIITENDTSSVIDKCKIQRARKKSRMNNVTLNNSVIYLQSLYFDGKKDQTLTQTQINGSMHKRTVVEEHITLLTEPKSQYVGHFTTATGSSQSIVNGILDYCSSNEISFDDVAAVGCDGTAVNTGRKGGVIKLLEDHFNKPLQWLICLLHTNELPLRHLMKELDGGTSGPEHFAGLIGKQLVGCELLDIVNFEAVQAPEINIDKKDLSCDQKYLLSMFKAVRSGFVSAHLASQKPGPVNHARWLTTACRILRLYIATSQPSSKLIDLVQYIMNVYIPVWFSIKKNNSMTDGSRHFFKLMKYSQSMTQKVRVIVNRVLQRNAFFAHPENMLIAMLLDEEEHVRELGWRRILKCRINSSGGRRIFVLPKLNFDAVHYYEMINWQTTAISEPPVVSCLSNTVIENYIKSRMLPSEFFPSFPCHTQAVERAVKLVTEASGCVVKSSERDGYILAKLQSRKKIPRFDAKKDFVV